MKILVVEDDPMIRQGICEYLDSAGYEMSQAEDGRQAVEIFHKLQPDLLILDINLPYRNGLDLLSDFRQVTSAPALILTAYGDEAYQLEAYQKLADGYMEKPFSLPVLKARIESLLTRHYGDRHTHLFTYQGVEVDFKAYTGRLDGVCVEMNAKEIDVLKVLVDHQGQALSRGQIIDAVWSEVEDPPSDRVIDVYIKELRRKLDLDCIVTVRNVGYKLERL